MRLFLSISFIFLILPGFMAAQAERPQSRPIQMIDSILKRLETEDEFNGNVLISERGKIIYEKSFGWENYEKRVRLSKDTLFPIGSISKTLTAAAVLKLKEDGQLKLDDFVTKYLPDLPYPQITIRQMLSHTSGLLEYQSDTVIKEIKEKGLDNGGLEKVYARLKLPLDFEPGSRWDYSNTNYIFLALVIEKASGLSYPQYLRKNIFKPARMEKTFVLDSSLPPRLKKYLAKGYRRTSFVAAAGIGTNIEALSGANSYYATVSNLYGAGGIYSTARDLQKFGQALQNNKLFKSRTQAEMYEAARLNDQTDYSALKNTNYEAKYGLGWFIAVNKDAGRIVYHPGGTVGYVSYLLRNPDREQCVVILTNSESLKHYTPTALMRVLDSQPFKLDNKSLAVSLGREYNRHGLDGARRLFGELKNNPDYSFRETEINALGYQLLLEKKDASAALEMLKLNAEKFPASFDVWDSLGEIYYRIGNRAEAIKNYEKSLQLNPNNEGGKQMLEKIRQENTQP